MQKKLTLTVLLAILGFIVFFSCNKSDFSHAKKEPSFTNPKYPMNIRLARRFYDKLKRETGTEVTDIHIKRKSGDPVNRKYLIWQNAWEGQTDSSTFVEVPMLYNKRPSDIIVSEKDASPITAADKILNASFDRLVISKNKQTGKVQVYIVTYIPDLKTLNTRQDISSNHTNAFEKDFSGFLKYRSWDGTPLFLYRVHQGKLKKRMMFNQGGKPSNASRRPAGNARAAAVVCTVYCNWEYVQNCSVGIAGDYVTEHCGEWVLMNTTCWLECQDDGTDPDPDPDPDPGGGGGDPVPFVSVNNVINELTSPCFQSTFARMTEARVKSFITNMYMNTFVGMDKVHNLRIKEQANLTFQGEAVPALSYRDPADHSTWVIVLNSDYAAYGSEEAWAGSIFHEMVHGFIRMNSLNFNPSTQWSQEHENMLHNWIDRIAEGITAMYGTNATDATAIALAGLEDILKDEVTDTFLDEMNTYVQNTYNISLPAADQIHTNYVLGTSGKPCN